MSIAKSWLSQPTSATPGSPTWTYWYCTAVPELLATTGQRSS